MNDTPDTHLPSWIGPWILVTLAVFAVLTTSRSPFMVGVYVVTLACGIALCVHDQRERGR